MRHAFTFVGFVVISAGASANWQAINASDKFTLYADSVTIQRAGDKVRMRVLWDHKPPNKGNFNELSSVESNEFDCKANAFRLVTITTYAQPMGKGAKAREIGAGANSNPAWSQIGRGTAMELAYRFACSNGKLPIVAKAPQSDTKSGTGTIVKGNPPFTVEQAVAACSGWIRQYTTMTNALPPIHSMEVLKPIRPDVSGLPAGDVPKTDRLYPTRIVSRTTVMEFLLWKTSFDGIGCLPSQ